MAVVAANEFHDAVPSCVSPGQTDGGHGSFCAGVNHAHHIHGGNQFTDQFGQRYFRTGRSAEAGSFGSGFLHGFRNDRVGVA